MSHTPAEVVLAGSEPARGWLLKYSLGKGGFFASKNWQRRYFVSSEQYLRYYKSESEKSASGCLGWDDVVAVIPNATMTDHPAAVTPGAIYFALRVNVAGSGLLVLLMEASNEEDRARWVAHAMMKLRGAEGLPKTADPSVGTFGIKQLVSQHKKRHVVGEFDLDLSFITKRIVAMGFPAEGGEAFYRNAYTDVFNFLEKFHKGKYKVYNLCSERWYSEDRFFGSFSRYP